MDLELFNRISVFSSIREARVKAHRSHSKKGKVFNVREHPRETKGKVDYKKLTYPAVKLHDGTVHYSENNFKDHDQAIAKAFDHLFPGNSRIPKNTWELTPKEEKDQHAYQKFFDSFYSSDKYGIVGYVTKGNKTFIPRTELDKWLSKMQEATTTVHAHKRVSKSGFVTQVIQHVRHVPHPAVDKPKPRASEIAIAFRETLMGEANAYGYKINTYNDDLNKRLDRAVEKALIDLGIPSETAAGYARFDENLIWMDKKHVNSIGLLFNEEKLDQYLSHKSNIIRLRVSAAQLKKMSLDEKRALYIDRESDRLEAAFHVLTHEMVHFIGSDHRDDMHAYASGIVKQGLEEALTEDIARQLSIKVSSKVLGIDLEAIYKRSALWNPTSMNQPGQAYHKWVGTLNKFGTMLHSKRRGTTWRQELKFSHSIDQRQRKLAEWINEGRVERGQKARSRVAIIKYMQTLFRKGEEKPLDKAAMEAVARRDAVKEAEDIIGTKYKTVEQVTQAQRKLKKLIDVSDPKTQDTLRMYGETLANLAICLSLPKRVQEATTTVDAHISHSKLGKVFNVKQHKRIIKASDDMLGERNGEPISTYDNAKELGKHLPNLWTDEYRKETITYLANSIERGKEEIKSDGGMLRTEGKDILITLRRIGKDEQVHLRGDLRYSHEAMTKVVQAGGELAAVQIGKSNRGMHILDGHHRWRAYRDAGVEPLAIVTEIIPGIKGSPKVHLHVNLPSRETIQEVQVRVKSHTRKTKHGTERVKQYVRVLHGTEREVSLKAVPMHVLDKIVKYGIKRGPINRAGNTKRPPSVYFTESEADAHEYGAILGGGGDYAIIAFTIPEADFKKAITDEYDQELSFGQNSWRLEHRNVPADWIKSIKVYHRWKGEPELVRIVKESAQRLFYTVVLLDKKIREATIRVKAYSRVRKGKRQLVRASTRNVKTADKMKIIGATPNEDKWLREIMARHDPKVLAAVPFVAVMNRKDFQRAINNTKRYKDYKADGTEVGWYDERKAFIIINRSAMTSPNDFKEVLDHELGHVTYYHSSKSNSWFNAHGDPKFDRFTWYSKTDEAEAFAESYMSYISTKGKAKSPKYAKVYSVIDTVLSGVTKKNWNASAKYIPGSNKGDYNPYD